MPSLKYDASDVESGSGEQAPEGTYNEAKIVSITHRKQKANGDPANDLEVVVDVDPDYSRIWTYVQLEGGGKFRLRELTDALGMPPKGDLDKLLKVKNAKVRAKVTPDSYGGEYRARIGKLWAYKKDADDGEEPPEDGDAPATSSALAGIDPELLVDLKDDPEFYEEWPDEDIKSFVEDLEIAGNISGRYSRKKAIDAITSLAGSASSINGEEAGGDDYEDWDLDDLTAELEERKIDLDDIKVSGRKSDAKLKTAYIAALREDDGGDPFKS